MAKKKALKAISLPIPTIPITPPTFLAGPRIVPLFRKAHTNHHLAIAILDSGITNPVAATVTFVLGAKVIQFEDIKVKKSPFIDMISLVAKRKPPVGPVLHDDDAGVGTIVVTIVGPPGTDPVPVSGTGGLGEPTP
jgi:hypothetical protein